MMVLFGSSISQQLILPNSCMPGNTPSFLNEILEIDLSDPQAKTLIVKPSQEFGFFKLVKHDISMDLIAVLEADALNFFENPRNFRCAVEEYISATKKLSCQVLELMAEGLGIEEKNMFSKLLRDKRSDCVFRLNYYPPYGTWVSVPPDNTSFFVNVGDTLQIMTNGRFKSVKHRVVPDTSKSKLSMIYFAGIAFNEKIRPLPCLMTNQEQSLYKELTWFEFKNTSFKHRLSNNRIAVFLKSPPYHIN
ncbi:hypothetical protein K1719_030340 [Acacia pycnantha]|nr:hypothetical protein K1719_030340 [Acacia pycnantha]